MISELKKIYNKACREVFENETVRQIFTTSTRFLKIGYEQASKYALVNGMVLHYKTDPGSKTIKARLHINAGSRFDPPGKEGLAHAVEHMLFMKHKANSESLLREIKKRGGRRDAHVGMTETEYEIELPRTAENETLVYDTLAKAVFSPRFDPDDLELEKEVLIDELYELIDNKNNLAYDFLEKSYGLSHSRGAGRGAGTEAGIRSLTVTDLETFHAQYYTGSNTTLEVTGMPVLTQTREKLIKAFCAIPSGATSSPPSADLVYKPSFSHQIADTRQTEIGVFLPILKYSSDFEIQKALFLADYIKDQLDAGLRGRRQRITYSPCVELKSVEENHKVIDINIKARPHNIQNIVCVLTDILATIADGKIDEESWCYILERRKTMLQNSIPKKDAEIKAPFDRLQDKAGQYRSRTILSKVTPQHIIEVLQDSLKMGASLITRGQAPVPGAYEALRQLSTPRESAEPAAVSAHSPIQPQAAALS